MELVQDFLEKSAIRTPDKTALVVDGKRLSYLQIDKRANRLACALRANGFERGDRAILFLPNSEEIVVAIFATLKAGGTFVAVNPTTKFDKFVYIANNCSARALVTSGRQAEMLATLSTTAPSLTIMVLVPPFRADNSAGGFLNWDEIQLDYPPTCPERLTIDLDLACLIYTSGSTGEPKGVMSDHSNVIFAADSIISYLENSANDIVINMLPLSFDYGLYQLLMTFRFGGTLILEKGFAFPAAILKRMEVESVTGLPGVPTIFAVLLNMDLSSYDLTSLRYITNTAAALPTAHIQGVRAKFPGVTLFSMYGLTETKRTLYLPPDQLDVRPDSVGIPIPGTEAWVEDERGNRLGPDQIGELVVRGRHVMRGYWGDETRTAVRFRPGENPWEQLCYTGDLFRRDTDGYFYFVARKDDIIKSRGEKVAPKEVENVIYRLQGVMEVAAIGVPDSVMGEAIKVFVVSDLAALTEKQVLNHCRQHLEDFMVPKFVEFCDSLPKTSSGKIKRKGLE